MALSPRERLIVVATGLAAAVFVGDRYVYRPYSEARRQVADERVVLSKKINDNLKLMARKKRLENDERAWKQKTGGLTNDPAEAERQLLAVRDWAQEAGLTGVATTPRREPRADRTQIVRLDASANGSLAAVSKLLWRVETSSPPLKVDELDLRSRTDGADDLEVTFKVSTIWDLPGDAAGRTPTGAGARPSGAPGTSDGGAATPRRPARREDL